MNMTGAERDCCASKGCCGGDRKGKDSTATCDGQEECRPESRHCPLDGFSSPSPSQSITTASDFAFDEYSKSVLKSSHGEYGSNDPESTEDADTKSSQRASHTSLPRKLLHCCQPSTASSCCKRACAPRIRSMAASDPSHDHIHDSHEFRSFAKTSSTWNPGTCYSGSHDRDEEILKEPVALCSSVRDGGERGPTCFQRIILIVSGLKCGCCESGLANALSHIPAIKNYQVNIVLARIEFDLNTSELSIQEVISRLHKDTGYTFERLEQPDGQILELQVSDPAELYRAEKPFGVTLLESKDNKSWNPAALLSGRSSAVPTEVNNVEQNPHQAKNSQEKRRGTGLFMYTIRVHYNAKQIGARNVFEYYKRINHNGDLQLASMQFHPSLSVGFYQTKRASLMFLVTLAFTLPVLVFAWAPVDQSNLSYAHASLALATVVQVIATREFVPGALQSLIHSGLFEMDFLIAVSTTTAYIFSVVSYVFQIKEHPLETGSFFETSTLLVTLILLGRAVNEFARFRAAKSVSIRTLQTNEAFVVTSEGPLGPGVVTRKIDARLLQYGDHFKVPPHTRIVTDGKVVYGGSEVDESMVTGESVPVAKGLGHQVHAGTMNGAGQLVVELTKLPHENSISRIAAMVENAELSKPKVQALADKIAGYFIPVIGIIGILVFLIWLFIDRYHNNRKWGDTVVRALTYAIATLIVSCPCAIGLAVPMVVLIAGGTSARFGIIFRDPQKLEIARNTTDVVFDKTGTLTKGQLAVVDYDGTDAREISSMIVGLLEGDKHPVAAAVFRWMEEDQKNKGEAIIPANMVDIQSEPGKGVRGKLKGRPIEVRAGNPQWLGVSVLESQHTLLCVTVGGILCATFRLQDRPRDGADEVVRLLQNRNIRVHMISGDGEGPVNAVAHMLNIPRGQTRWRCQPEDKQRYVHELQKDRRVVCFCGDGTNDSAALKQADVGVHMNQGTDVAKSASDVVLMTTRLHDVLVLLDISRAAYRRIIANFSWSAIYNVVAILMASGAFVKVRIAPAYAGLGELVSVLPILLIAFQMKWRDYGRKYIGRAKEQR